MTEVGIGLLGIGGGITFYPMKVGLGKVSPYSGLKYTYMVLIDVGAGGIAYIPMGLTYFSKWGFNFGVDIGPAFGNWEYMNRNHNPTSSTSNESDDLRVWGNVKIGIRF